MSRKRDTNWSRDEITVLLDSIMEITRTRANDNKRTNSREVFEYAAKKMGEKGHASRAEREKCRTKWKKMKEEFTHAKRAREGDSRFKEAPGIQPFFDRMEEFINGNFDNISPHSTIVRRTSSLSSGRPSSSSSTGQQVPQQPQQQQAMRTSARIAANTNGTTQILTTTSSSSTNNNNSTTNSSLNDNNMDQDTNSTIATKITTDYSGSNIHTPSNASSLSPRQNSRLSSSTNSNNNNNVNNNVRNNRAQSSTTLTPLTTTSQLPIQSNQQQSSHNHNHIHNRNNNNNNNNHQQSNPKGDLCIYTNAYNNPNVHSGHNNNNNNINNNQNNNNHLHHNHNNLSSPSTTSTNLLYPGTNDSMQIQNNNNITNADHADISYRVSTGYRQITIFGDHDVDIKFRGDCVTINKIDLDCIPSTQTGPLASVAATNDHIGN